MPYHQEQVILPYTPQQVFALVADVASYPAFLPWCTAARIMEPAENGFLAELAINYKHLHESYVSRVSLDPYQAIDVVMVRGPFKHLTNQWRFSPHEDGTRVDFTLDFAFRSKLLESLLGAFFTRATTKMVGAFTARAAELYGKH